MAKKRLNLSKSKIFSLETNLVAAQLESYQRLVDSGLREMFDEIDPLTDYNNSLWSVSFGDLRIGIPNTSIANAFKKGTNYDAPVYIKAFLTNQKTKEVKSQELFVMDLPLITERATFIVNGTERVIIQQIVRSEGVLKDVLKTSTAGKQLKGIKLIPLQGKWYSFEVNKAGVMSVRLIDNRPRILITEMLKAIGYSGEEIRNALSDVDTGDIKFLEATLSKDKTKSRDEAVISIYQKLRPEDNANLANAKAFIEGLFFNRRRFWLGRTGRYQVNRKLHGLREFEITDADCLLRKDDLLALVRSLVKLNNDMEPIDDIDSLANRRIRGIGELIQEKLREGVLRMEKAVRDRMSTFALDDLVTPALIVNTRPISNAMMQFFGSSEVSRFMDQQNILSELNTKRRITSAGPGGLSKESATFGVRDVHPSYYSRFCPVETPEGQMIGMIANLSIYARINEFGYVEAPYRKVMKGDEYVKHVKGKAKSEIVPEAYYISDQIDYLSADNEVEFLIAPATVKTDETGKITDHSTFCRYNLKYVNTEIENIDYVDVDVSQTAGIGLALVPYSRHDDASRTLMAANVQRQAVPLIKAEAPIVGTGMEKIVGKYAGRAIFAETDGVVEYVDAKKVIVKYDEVVNPDFRKTRDIIKGGAEDEYTKVYNLIKFIRTNQSTCFNQIPVVSNGQKVKKGDLLVQGPSMEYDELALGTNLLAAYMPWDGYNFEDGIVLSERAVKEDILTSIHINEYTQEIRETKLGDEELTRDIPGVPEHALRNLDQDGLIRVGAYVNSGDILAGIVAPKGDTEVSAEEKLLRVIFGESAKEVRDNSLKVDHGDYGVVIDIQILDAKKGDKLGSGVLKLIKVYIARTQKMGIGDKLTGRHGDKGIVTKILPVEDMPHMADGTPVDIVLSPVSIVKRMNLGQLKEAHIGMAAYKLGINVAAPPFAELDEEQVYNELKKQGIDFQQKVDLYDGRTGEKFVSPVVVGMRYLLKLDHLVSNKIHARSVGPYTIITQQPIGGKAQFGGQRFGEMEVWALEAHGVPYMLQELLATKSDDTVGRVLAYKAIINGNDIPDPLIPESYNVLKRELRSLGLDLAELGKEENSTLVSAEIIEGVDSVNAEHETIPVMEVQSSNVEGDNLEVSLD